MALGAERGDVLRMVLGMGSRLVGAGARHRASLASLAVTRVLSSQLFGVAPHDLLTLAVVIAVVVMAGAARLLLPGPPRHPRRSDGGAALRVGARQLKVTMCLWGAPEHSLAKVRPSAI